MATGPVDPAGTAGALVQGLRARGADAELAVWFEHPLGFAADRILPPLPRLGYVVALPLRRDVLHYQGFTWLRSARDATWARRLGRTLVVTFHGDDCRLYGVAQALFPARGRTGDPARDKLVRRRTRRLARLCDAALVPDLELATYVVPLFERVYVVPPPLHAWPPVPAAPRRAGAPVVVHAPSDPRFKGTPQVEAAVAALRPRLDLDFRLVTGTTYDVVAAEVAGADAVVDQLDSATIGVFALEAMRAGKPVLSELQDDALPPYQAGLPVIRVTAESLAAELERLLRDPERRGRLGDEGRRYVERMHDPPSVAAAILRVYEHARDGGRGLFEATPDGVRPLRREERLIRGRLDALRLSLPGAVSP